ncbi:MAG: hypothetical protein JSR19_08280 [Proteobacteria bacterium]|nr:hypothetical protein [Pseudomonadota bacterium]HQR04244.1 hypothetical protein [Rhodocyclaceae bacterium]
MSSLYPRLLEDPAHYFDAPYDAGYTLSRKQLDEVHLAGLQKRFHELAPAIATLGALAEEQGIREIRQIDDVVPLLFPHTVYKSYPLSIIERGEFDRLTRWLSGLTTSDLSQVDARGIDCIDDWIALLDKSTDVRVLHTFGTSGKLSFIPRSEKLWQQQVRLTGHCLRDWNGANSGPDLIRNHMPMVIPSYRHGAGSIHRGMNRMVDLFAGGSDNALFLYEKEYFSADVASLAGRLRAAEARGEQGQLALSPSLLARRDEFARREAERPARMQLFFEQVMDRFAGQDVFLFAVWPILYEWAEAGLGRGIKNVFGPNSILTTGGGSKGRVLPDNYREQIWEFLGFSRFFEYYSMSEIIPSCPRCDAGHFHIPPTLVPFVLDPESGKPLPRSGTQTGRFALMDLMADNYWGGLITGDEVTLSGWDQPCACGRHGPYLHSTIRRFSEKQGGDDKINCAGAPEAHDKAIEYLLQRTE